MALVPTLRRLALVAATVAALPAVVTAASFETIGLNAGVANISADGSTIVGTFTGGGGFKWTEAGGLESIGGRSAVGANADGSVIAGSMMDGAVEKAARWTEAGGWELLPEIPGAASCDAFFSSSFGIDDSGDVIVGLAWVAGCRAHGFVWENGVGSTDLGSTVPDRSSRANGVSGDGTRIVGWQDASTGFRQGARWDAGVQALFMDGGSSVGEAHAANPDGSIVVGQNDASGEAWRWLGTGDVEGIGALPGFTNQTRAWDVSDDGSVIVGFGSFGFDRDAFIWLDDGSGLQKLDTYLMSIGVTDAAGIDLGTATAVSADGMIIAGWGFDATFNTVGWRIDRTPSVSTPEVAGGVELLASRPNPFRVSTSIEYSVAEAGAVTLSIFDATGRTVRSLIDGPMTAGVHEARWDGRNDRAQRVAPGVYFVKAAGSASEQIGRIVLAR